MSEIVTKAFLAGLLSSCSMPLGTITSLVWKPKNRMLAFLTAFGAGALLAALVIDLVSNATKKGHLLELVIGSILGNLFFTVVNRFVNESGGFLRKPSTALVHLSQKQAQRFQRCLSRLRRIDIFRDLSPEDSQNLARSLLVAHYPQGTTIYQPLDPSESLYIIETGEVQLLDPQVDFQPYMILGANKIFGRLAFLTGTPHQMVALTTADTKLDIVPRPDFDKLLQTSPQLIETTQRLLQQEEVASYLQQRHGLTLPQVKDWVSRAIATIRKDHTIPDAVKVERETKNFLRLARQIRRFPLFKHLPYKELEDIANRLVYHHCEDGYAFFQPQETADRLFIVHQGEVELLDPNNPRRKPIILSSGDAFGGFSFVTGANHTVTAVAKTDATVWTLRKQDFDEMLQQSRNLEDALREFLQQDIVTAYLQDKQHFEPNKVSKWVQQALQSMNADHLLPSVTAMAGSLQKQEQAPTAIWLGLLMDGIPEALTIGAHVVMAPLSPSLIFAVLFSNYPEALSSSDGMREQGFPETRILLMWSAIMLFTGIVAAVGSIVFAEAPESIISLLEAMVAGAMLTVISETMLPEAYAKGGSVVGMSTLLGFLVTILIQSISNK
ncbi:MAG: cyclic nucleotide-binding domain-containing protein [Calothrix sp. MO_192.B10]|nr:cyclic nucleotide-binding domain-containing protein [Calothrix sp. MO_192.B10]